MWVRIREKVKSHNKRKRKHLKVRDYVPIVAQPVPATSTDDTHSMSGHIRRGGWEGDQDASAAQGEGQRLRRCNASPEDDQRRGPSDAAQPPLREGEGERGRGGAHGVREWGVAAATDASRRAVPGCAARSCGVGMRKSEGGREKGRGRPCGSKGVEVEGSREGSRRFWRKEGSGQTTNQVEGAALLIFGAGLAEVDQWE